MVKLRDDLSLSDLVNITSGLHKILPRFYDWAVIGIEQKLPSDRNLVMHLAKIGGEPGNEDDRRVLMLSFDYILRNFESFDVEGEEENEV